MTADNAAATLSCLRWASADLMPVRNRLTGHVRVGIVIVASLAFSAISVPADDGYPWLDSLRAEEDVREAGARLIALPEDLHRLDQRGDSPGRATVAAHGWNSAGYEWVHLLANLDNADTSTWFWRWDWNGCPSEPAQALIDRLAEAPFDGMERIRLIGHSYGGVLVTIAAERWRGGNTLEVHAIAAPLVGVGDRCAYRSPTVLPANVEFHEWRTRHELDGAFRGMPVDPQVVDIPGSQVQLLPATYNGRRLGHNWSVSWVGDKLAGKTPAP